MKVFKKILCPVDFSDYSSLALRYAEALCQENDAPLVVCHSIPDFSQTMSYLQGNYFETVQEALISDAKEKLERFVNSLTKVDVIQIIEQGHPAEIILQVAKRNGCDLIVMGTHGHSGYERFFMGSVTNKVLHKATIPVFTVCRPTHHFIRENEPRPVQIKKILCPLDYEPNSRPLAKLALKIGRMYQAEVTIFHSVPKANTKEWPEQEQWVKNKLMEFVDPSEDWCTVRFLIQAGEPSKQILEIIEKNEIDLVVIGHHSRNPIEELVLGSVAKRVLTDAVCPVLVARSYFDVPSKGLTLLVL